MSPILKFEPRFIQEVEWLHAKISEHGLRTGFELLIAEFPILREAELTISIDSVHNMAREGSQLIDKNTALLSLLSRRLLNHVFLEMFLRHELLRVSDMLNPLFGYDSELSHNLSLNEETLWRRFMFLWDASIAERLGYEARQYNDFDDPEGKNRLQITYFHFKEKKENSTFPTLKGLLQLAAIK
jgi:hypothetical protein